MTTENTKKDNWNAHWDQYAESAKQNPAQAYRRKLIFSHLRASNQSIRVLDVGSGQGDFAMDLKRSFPQAEVLGIELSHSGVEISRKKVPEAQFIEQDLNHFVEPLPKYKQWATHAICSEVLEHTDHPEKILANIRPYLAPGCRFIITVPGGPMSQFDKHIGHRKHFRPQELRDLLEKSGFRVNFLSGAGFPFFNLYRLVVLARGKKLIEDVAKGPQTGMSPLALFVMRVFSLLFLFNFSRSKLGWQVLAVSENKAGNLP